MNVKSVFKSKTFWFFLLYGLVRVAGLFGFVDFQPTADQEQLLGIVVAAVGLILRYLTSQAVKLPGQ